MKLFQAGSRSNSIDDLCNSIRSCPSNGKFVAFFCRLILFRSDSRAPLKLISIFPLRTNYPSMEFRSEEFNAANNELRFEVLKAALEFFGFWVEIPLEISNICIIDLSSFWEILPHVLWQTRRSCNILTTLRDRTFDIKWRLTEIRVEWKQKSV